MFPQGTGWIPDRPDPRDYGPGHKNSTQRFGRIDLTPFFPLVFRADYLGLADFGLGTPQ